MCWQRTQTRVHAHCTYVPHAAPHPRRWCSGHPVAFAYGSKVACTPPPVTVCVCRTHLHCQHVRQLHVEELMV